jgi:hypothetical protein
LKNYIIGIIALLMITSCKQRVANTGKKDSTVVKTVVIKKNTVVKKSYPLTDSGQLMLHLDSLPQVVLPHNTANDEWFSRPGVSLSSFKNKKLFNIPIQLIPTLIGGGFVDHGEDLDENGKLPDSIKESFNLVDSNTHNIKAKVLAVKAKFIVLDVEGILITLNYKIEVIDAIHTDGVQGNNHWQTGRDVTINKNLTLKIHHYYSVQTDEEGHRDYQNEYETWFIDADGHIKKKPEKHSKKHKA